MAAQSPSKSQAGVQSPPSATAKLIEYSTVAIIVLVVVAVLFGAYTIIMERAAENENANKVCIQKGYDRGVRDWEYIFGGFLDSITCYARRELCIPDSDLCSPTDFTKQFKFEEKKIETEEASLYYTNPPTEKRIEIYKITNLDRCRW